MSEILIVLVFLAAVAFLLLAIKWGLVFLALGASFLAVILGCINLPGTDAGLGLIGLACYLAIIARIIQAHQNKD